MTASTSSEHVTKTEWEPHEKALYEFMVMFSLHERDMLVKLVEWYPQAAKELAKGITNMREMARILR